MSSCTKRSGLHAVAICVALGLLACSRELDWREIKSDEGRFTAMVPGKPRYETRALSGGSGGAAATMHLWSAQARKSVFGVGYADYPAGNGGILDSTQSALVANIHGNLLEESRILRNGLAGRALVAQGGDTVLRAQLWVSGRRLYQLAVLGPGNDLSAADVELFFSSFSPRNPGPGN
jgi:hypothetical protein